MVRQRVSMGYQRRRGCPPQQTNGALPDSGLLAEGFPLQPAFGVHVVLCREKKAGELGRVIQAS